MIGFPVILINSLSILMICIVILVAWRKRSASCVPQLITMSVFMLIWAVCTFMETVSSGMEQKIMWRNITQIGAFGTPAAALMFSIAYSGILKKYSKILSAVIYLIQTMAVLFIFTDQWHHLARTGIYIVKGNGYDTLIVNTTVWTRIFISFNFLYMLVALILVTAQFFTTARSTKKQVLCILAGMLVSTGYSLIKIATNERFGIMVPISGVFALADFGMLYGILRYDMFLLTPIARNEVFHVVNDGIIIASPNGKIIDANRAAIKMFSLEENKHNSSLMENLGQEIAGLFPEWFETLKHCGANQFNLYMDKGSLRKYYQCDIYSLNSREQRGIGSISVIKDITEQKINTDLLKSRAEIDGLTGAYNRRTFIEKVEKTIKDTQEKVWMLFIDIDYFKNINDQYGHVFGDHVLEQICGIIRLQLKEEELMGRMGGEEFAVFGKGAAADDVYFLAENIRTSIDSNRFYFGDSSAHVTISIGAVCGPYISFDKLYRTADFNLYKAKEEGRNCVRF